jgi:molecular chaperone HtpG
MIPIHDSLCILSGDSFEDRVRLDWPPPFLENDSDIDILGSSSVNGIFCLFNGYGNETVLWNPATEEFKIIPPSYEPYDNNYEPAGFCYDCIRDDYKVIRFAPCYQVFEGSWVWLPDKDCHLWESNELLDEVLEDDYEFWDGFKIDMYDEYWEIYSLRSNSWRKLDGVDLPDSWGSSTSRNVNLNGFCHWYNYRNNIVSFDFRNETFFTTTLPSDLGKQIELQEKQLLELNGSISLICNFKTKDFFDIWILGELGVKESWAKFFVVGPLTCSVMRPIGAGKKRFIFFRKKYDDELAWYDFSTQRISEIGAKGELLSLKIVTYKENLVPFREMINQ